MRQSQRQPKSAGMSAAHTIRAQSSRITTLNIMIAFIATLIVLFLLMSVLGIGPFSWGN